MATRPKKRSGRRRPRPLIGTFCPYDQRPRLPHMVCKCEGAGLAVLCREGCVDPYRCFKAQIDPRMKRVS